MTSEVFNTDCLEYMRTLPDKAFQLAIADPPYGINAKRVKDLQTIARRLQGTKTATRSVLKDRECAELG